jgi:hypothetical protein
MLEVRTLLAGFFSIQLSGQEEKGDGKHKIDSH